MFSGHKTEELGHDSAYWCRRQIQQGLSTKSRERFTYVVIQGLRAKGLGAKGLFMDHPGVRSLTNSVSSRNIFSHETERRVVADDTILLVGKTRIYQIGIICSLTP